MSLTKEHKVAIIMNAPEVLATVKLLIVLMMEIEAKNYVRSEYVVEDETFSLTLKRETRAISTEQWRP